MTLFRFFDLVDLQARATLKAEASRLYLSYIWWVLEPMLFVLVFYIVFETLLQRGGDDFVLFLMCGKIPYLWVNKSIMSSCTSLPANRGLIGKLDVPKVMFPYVAMQEVLYKQWVVYLVLFGTAIGFGNMPGLHWLWLIPIVITTYLLLVPLSLIAALLCALADDFRIFISMGMLFVMFASGIFWDINDIENEQWRELLLTANPMAFLIDCYRNVLMGNGSIDAAHLGLLAGLCILATAIVHRVYDALRYQLTQHILES